jgi:hypothetical protein
VAITPLPVFFALSFCGSTVPLHRQRLPDDVYDRVPQLRLSGSSRRDEALARSMGSKWSGIFSRKIKTMFRRRSYF